MARTVDVLGRSENVSDGRDARVGVGREVDSSLVTGEGKK